jgi:hypothetical protein
MLNSKGERELAYIVKIDDIFDMDGVNNQIARVGGWTVFVKRNEFKKGDLAVYFEIDSKLPAIEYFSFMEKYHYKVKTQKYVKGRVISQGLLVHPNDLGLTNYKEGDFLTEKLGVTYYEPEDNTRKAASADKYKIMASRHPKLFRKRFIKWLYSKSWGKKLLFVFFGKKHDKKVAWPAWVAKTDEERCQNLPYLFPGSPDETWIATEKIDGTSTTFTMKRNKRNKKKNEFYVCSRNVVFDRPDKSCFYDTNVYLEMAEKYHVKDICQKILNDYSYFDFVTIQGETYGGNIQKRNYGDEHRLAVFNIIFGFKDGTTRRLNPVCMAEFLENYKINKDYNLTPVPIIDENFHIPETCDELLKIAEAPSKIDGGMREGLVFRSIDGKRSFKAVSNAFLLKYHAN